ncbi:hypothetical protein [Mycolicibacterium cosmeticum]|uniref:hypothetical protein n=1 Tax=Mycolicibacterium cosmeticum TaxID=258533 RepID=UPI003204C754
MPTITPAGPIYGPDALAVTIDDRASRATIRIYPDAANIALREAGMATRYYLQPTSATAAPRQTGPGFDFSMAATVRRVTGKATIEYVNATGTLTTAVLMPASAPDAALKAVTGHDHPQIAARIQHLFERTDGDATPELSPLPRLNTTVSCTFTPADAKSGPPRFSAQFNPAGSVEAQARSAFLLTCGPGETDAIATSLKTGGAMPLAVDYVLTEQFSTGDSELTVAVDVDVDTLHQVFASAVAPDAAVSANTASAVFAQALTAGCVRLRVTHDNTVLDGAVAAWMATCVEVKTAALDLVTAELFDVSDGPAAGPAWWTALTGQSNVTLKPTRSPTGIHLQTTQVLSGSLSAERRVPTDFSALTAAAKTDITTYLTEIGAH